MIDDDLEKEATLYADENYDSYLDSENPDYKQAWCEAYADYMENDNDIRW